MTAHEQGRTISEIARSAHASRKAIYKWLGRYELEQMKGLMPRKPGARTGTHPMAISKRVISRIIELYEEEDYGIRSIAHLLAKEDVKVSGRYPLN